MSQPLNQDISVRLNIRSYRASHRHEAVAALTKGLRPLVLSVPGQEILVGVLNRDTTVADFSPYMGQPRHGAARGFPIVVGLLDRVSFANAQTNLPDAAPAFAIGHDKFIHNTDATLSGDLYGDAQDLTADISE